MIKIVNESANQSAVDSLVDKILDLYKDNDYDYVVALAKRGERPEGDYTVDGEIEFMKRNDLIDNQLSDTEIKQAAEILCQKLKTINDEIYHRYNASVNESVSDNKEITVGKDRFLYKTYPKAGGKLYGYAQITSIHPYDDADYYWAKVDSNDSDSWDIVYKGKVVDNADSELSPEDVATILARYNSKIEPRIDKQ